MAGVDGSSDSDLFTATRPKSRPSRHRNSNNNNAVEALSSTLHVSLNIKTYDSTCYTTINRNSMKIRDDSLDI